MFQTQMITTVVDWERRLQIDEERRKNLRGEPYTDMFTNPQPRQAEGPSFFARLFGRSKERKPVYTGRNPDCCPESQTA
jgi:hypothetical protein